MFGPFAWSDFELPSGEELRAEDLESQPEEDRPADDRVLEPPSPRLVRSSRVGLSLHLA